MGDRALVHRRTAEVRRAPAQPRPSPRKARVVKLGRKLPPLTEAQQSAAAKGPDWVEANPRRIEKALARALARPTGGWYVLGASRRLRALPKGKPTTQWVAGREWVLWRDDAALRVAPNACPHMGARLNEGPCEKADSGYQLRCPWHGLQLDAQGRGAWQCAPVHDDGVLTWLRLPEPGQTPTPQPRLPPRPTTFLDGVIEVPAFCESQDVIANRLDPWHGVHLHPYGFAELAMIEEAEESETEGEPDRMLLRVAKRIVGPLCVEVDISFHCEDARTIVMTILDGEGKGSVVETHVTPMWSGTDPRDPAFAADPRPRAMITEATLATSDRPGFEHAPKIAALIRPFIRRAAHKLWVDDVAYAERLAELRSAGEPVLKVLNARER